MKLIQYPPDGISCCDFDDDGSPDFNNNLLLVLSIIPNYDPQANMTFVVNDGSVAVLMEWLEFPDDISAGGLAEFNVFRGNPTSPPPPGPYDTVSRVMGVNDWDDGEGLFQVTRDSFDARGPRVRYRDNNVEDGVLLGGPSTLNVTVPIEELGIDLSLTLYDAYVKMHIETEANASGPDEIITVPQTLTGTSGPVTVGGGEVGGYVRADDVMRVFNDGASECDCASPYAPGTAPPLIEYGERISSGRAQFTASCQWTPLELGDVGYSCGTGDSPMCETLGQLCTLLPGLPLFLDIDTNKNQANDAFSIGLYFDLVGASLDTPPVSP